MCRLALMNKAAITFLGPSLDYVFGYLESTLGGDGNGIAGLWEERGVTKIRKGVDLSAAQASTCAQKYASQGADWVLFHTRRATSSVIADQHCHPFRSGQLVMAHNGHDAHFATLSKSIGISDSECMARSWSRVHLPLPELATRSGVFIGFAHDHPFVVKGQKYSDLVAAWDQATGAILFASELPSWLAEGVFQQVVEISTIQWFGRDLDRKTLDARPYSPRPVSSAFYRHWGTYSWEEDEYSYLSSEERLYQEELEAQEALYEEEDVEEEDWRLQRQGEQDRYRS